LLLDLLVLSSAPAGTASPTPVALLPASVAPATAPFAAPAAAPTKTLPATFAILVIIPGDDLRVVFFVARFFFDPLLDFFEPVFAALPVELFFVDFFVAIFAPYNLAL